jgi:hypothetical protein
LHIRVPKTADILAGGIVSVEGISDHKWQAMISASTGQSMLNTMTW